MTRRVTVVRSLRFMSINIGRSNRFWLSSTSTVAYYRTRPFIGLLKA
jgi:hypothetical protein